MYVNKRRMPFIIIILILMAIPGGVNHIDSRLWASTLAPAPAPDQEKEKKRVREKEALLFQDIPVVITAARKEQPITEAPTTITVISAEDIRYSGATNIPDVLRMVAGVDVMTITARDQQVGVRGFIGPVNNKLLVLVDGRSVYTDLYGLIFWETFPVGLEEIQRIEVVKSPASSLYGANAYSGVINIISKSPQQLKGTTFRLTAGSQNSFTGSIIHAGNAAKKRINYKISAEWDSTDGWNENTGAEKTREVIRANALFAFSINKKTELVLSGGRGHSKNRKLYPDEAIGPGVVNDYTDYFQFDVRSANLEFRTFFKWEKPVVQWLSTGTKQTWTIATYDAELLHSFNIGKTHSLIWGINYRHNRLEDNPFIMKDQQQDLWALFLENELKISDKLRMTLGGRYDTHPLARGHFSPRGNIFYSPNEKQSLRLSVARAFRSPSFVDSYLYLENQLTTTVSLPPPLPPLAVPYIYYNFGNQDLKSEGITAYEMGYHSLLSDHLTLDLNLFYNRYSDFFTMQTAFTFYEEGELFPGSPGGVFPKVIRRTIENVGDAWGIGGEIQVDYSLNKQVSGFVNYSFQQVTDEDDDPSTAVINEEDRVRPACPKHKLNAGLRVLFANGISVNLLAHWVDRTEKLIWDADGNRFLAVVKDYFMLNTRMGYSFWKEKAELSLSIFNLFNNKHYEYPTLANLPVPNSDRIGRRISLTLRVKF